LTKIDCGRVPSKVISSSKANCNGLRERVWKAEARIKELEAELTEMHNNALEVAGFLAEKENLEAALVEERAKVIMLIEKLKLVANDPNWQSKGLEHDFDWYMTEARKEIAIIEPDDQHR